MTSSAEPAGREVARTPARIALGVVLLLGWAFVVAFNTGMIGDLGRPEEWGRLPGQWIPGQATLESLAAGRFREPFLNVVLFLPLGVILAWLFRARMRTVVLIAALSSCAIETYQWFFASDRITSVDDVALNTIGAVLGAGVVYMARRLASRRSAGLSEDAK